LLGYLKVKDEFLFTSIGILRAHIYQKKGYPCIDGLKTPWKENTDKCNQECARINAINDQYDAFTTRINKKYGRILNNAETKEEIILTFDHDPDQIKMVDLIYDKGILVG
jgi:hypothetical protein